MTDDELLAVYREAIIQSVVNVAGEHGETAARVTADHPADKQRIESVGLRAIAQAAWADGHSAGRDDFVDNDGSWPTTPNPYDPASK